MSWRGIAEDIADHLNALRDEFQRYLSRIVAENAQPTLIGNLFRCEVGTVEESLQEKFLEPYDSSTKDEYNAMKLERF